MGGHYSGILLVNLGTWGVGGIFDTFWYGTEDSEEAGPETKISGRDLDFGRGVDGRSFEICSKK